MTPDLEPVAICLVTFNSGPLMLDCLTPLKERGKDVTIKVWDNGSTDGMTPRILRSLKSQGLIDELHLSPDDPGFAVGANHLIRRSPNEAILLLNPDAVIGLECLTRLRQAAADPSIGVIAPVVRGEDDIEVMSAGRQPRLWPIFTHYSGLSRAFPHVRFLRGRHLFLASHGDEDHDVEWVSGACLLIPQSTVARVGILAERWFMYAEDTEYCQRVLEAGLKVKVLASAHAYHAVAASEGGIGDTLHSELDGGDLTSAKTDAYATPEVGPGPDLTGMWARNSYDYYVRQFKPKAPTRLAWRLTFSAGLACRAALRLSRNRDDRIGKKLLENSTALW